MYKVMRIAVRAIIKNERKVLVIKRVKNNKTYWVFPGGGVDEGEGNQEALIRECKEELGVEVEVSELLKEYVFEHPEFGGQQEFYYFCKIIGGQVGTGDGPEYQENSTYDGTYEPQWLKLSKIADFDLRPIEIRDIL